MLRQAPCILLLLGALQFAMCFVPVSSVGSSFQTRNYVGWDNPYRHMLIGDETGSSLSYRRGGQEGGVVVDHNHGYGWGMIKEKKKKAEKFGPEDLGQLIFLGSVLAAKTAATLKAILKSTYLIATIVSFFILCTLLFWGIYLLLYIFLPAPAGRTSHGMLGESPSLNQIRILEQLDSATSS